MSPIIAGIESTLMGITTIRAFSAEDRFLDEFFDQIDKTSAAEYFGWMLARWVMLRFDWLNAISVFIITVSVVRSGVQPGLGGVSLVWICA